MEVFLSRSEGCDNIKTGWRKEIGHFSKFSVLAAS